MFWFFGQEACGILARWPGIEPEPPALGVKVLTTGLPGNPLCCFKITWLSADYNLKKVTQKSSFGQSRIS